MIIIKYLRYLSIKCFFRTGNITGIFGLPRAGKTTFSAAICACNAFIKSRYDKIKSPFLKRVHRALFPHFDNIYCTDVTIQNCIHIDYETFGTYDIPPHSLIIFEECGIGFDNRNWKTMPKHCKRLIALIGHKKSSIVWSSQTADVDKSLRVRSHRLYLIKKSRLPLTRHVSFMKPIDYTFSVDDEQGELRDIYHLSTGFSAFIDILLHRSFWFGRKPFYKYFDSYYDDFEYPADTPV